jgi:hypothetical protein
MKAIEMILLSSLFVLLLALITRTMSKVFRHTRKSAERRLARNAAVLQWLVMALWLISGIAPLQRPLRILGMVIGLVAVWMLDGLVSQIQTSERGLTTVDKAL